MLTPNALGSHCQSIDIFEVVFLKKIGVFVGSLRKGSYSKKIAKALVSLLPSNIEAEFLDTGVLPLFNDDLDPNGVPEWNHFRRQLDSLDGLLIVTPEYNRSIPGALKNAMDIGSRPTNHFGGRVALVVSDSIGNAGGYGANHHLRQTFTTLNIIPVQRPEVYLAHTDTMFDEHDMIKNEGTISFLQSAIDAFTQLLYVTSLSKSVGEFLTDSTDPLSLTLGDGHYYHKNDAGDIVAEIKFNFDTPGAMTITSTTVEPELQGKGIAKQLVLKAIAMAKAYDLKIIPECSYAKSFFETHKNYGALVR